MTDLLERKEYLVGITIIEARNIQGLDSEGTSDPFVKVRCAGQIQQTGKKYETNSAIWNQTLTFTGIKMNQYELETFEMNLELFDHNALLANEIIGQYSIGLSTLYRNTAHEFYKKWVAMFNKSKPWLVQGYLLLSCFIVGPNEPPPFHSADEDFDPDGQDDDSEEDDDVIAARIENIRRAQGLVPVLNPNTITKLYQLSVVVVKGTDLPFAEKDVIKPFVSARVFGCVLTTSSQNNGKPTFNLKLQFPILYPIMNDKITLRVWHKRPGLKANMFVANIPEHPSQFDFFNISKLQANDGRMTARWINLYGTKPLERSKRTRGKKEGSQYLGRMLIAITMLTNERPQLQQAQGNPVREPPVDTYQLWVDLYELISCELISKGDPCWIVVSIGPHKLEKAHLKWSDKKKQYRYKNPEPDDKAKDNQTPAFKEGISLPLDPEQLPDIFVDVYTNSTFGGEERIAYMRIKAKNCLSKKPKPQWFRLSSPYNDTQGMNPGLLLCNIQFLKWDDQGVKNPERVLKKKTEKTQFRFYGHIHQGFELASALPEDKLDTYVSLQIGKNLSVDKFKTEPGKGRYPVWKYFSADEIVQLEKELVFEPDMRVTLYNRKTKLFGGLANIVIGEFTIPVESMTTYCEKPQFFNILNEEGQFMGQILANFHLAIYNKNQKKRKLLGKNYVDEPHEEMRKNFLDSMVDSYTVNIAIGIFGIRNLRFKARKPKITVYLSNQELEEKRDDENPDIPEDQRQIVRNYWVTDLDQDGDPNQTQVNTFHPTFGGNYTFENITLAAEPLLWPYIVIKVEDKVHKEALIHSFSGCEACFTTIPLLDYLEGEEFRNISLVYERAQLRRNQDRLQMKQEQIPPKKFLKANNLEDIDFKALALLAQQALDLDMPEGEQGGTMRMTGAAGAAGELIQGTGNTAGRTQNAGPDLFSVIVRGTAIGKNDEDLEAATRFDGGPDGGGGGDEQFEIGGNLDVSDDYDDFLNGGGGNKDQGPQDVAATGIIIEADNILELPVGPRDKKLEEDERQEKIDKCKEEIKGLQRKVKGCGPEEADQANKRKLLVRTMEVKECMEDLMEEAMNEDKFWGMLALDDEPGIDYGRDILKEGTFETTMRLPYKQQPLFTQQSWHKGEPTQILQVEGILRSGNPSGATMKSAIRITAIRDGEQETESEESDEDEGDQDMAGKPIYERVKLKCEAINDKYKFDILKPEFMKLLKEDADKQNYKVRVYLISAQNLTASGVMLDMKSRLAGMTALSSANPYPIVKVGDGLNQEGDKGPKTQKSQNDRDDAKMGELNPQYWSYYELDATFPEDAKLEVAIMDKGTFGDTLIGATTVDLENRLHSNLLQMGVKTLKVLADEAKKKEDAFKKDKKNKGPEAREKKKLLKAKAQELNRLWKDLKKEPQFYIPVEARELLHPSKAQAQGIVEMWTEVLTEEENRKLTPQKLIQMKKEQYEIRLIVWETRDVPLIDGDKVDIFVRVIWDPTGNPDDVVEKKTDIHKGSKTGWGQFNWRFKFVLEVPCDWPRIKFAIHDGGVFTDEAVGESTINLKRSLTKLQKEGFIEVPKTFISFKHPNKGDEDRGILMFSMTILPKEEADAEPVGEAQEEPNENPFLKKPTAGRGFGAGLSMGGFNLDLSFNPFGKYLPFVIAAVILGLLAAAAFMLK